MTMKLINNEYKGEFVTHGCGNEVFSIWSGEELNILKYSTVRTYNVYASSGSRVGFNANQYRNICG